MEEECGWGEEEGNGNGNVVGNAAGAPDGDAE